MLFRAPLLIVIPLLLLAAGCGADAPGNQDGPAPTAERRAGGLRLTLKTDKARYTRGQSVPMRLAAINDSSKTIDLTSSSSQTHDFIVRDRRGREVWRWSHGRAFAQVITERRLRPDERLAESAVWDQKDNEDKQAPAGKYSLEGLLTTIGPARSVGPVDITVID